MYHKSISIQKQLFVFIKRARFSQLFITLKTNELFVVVVVVFFFILHLQSVSVVDCRKPGLEERLFEAGCTDSRSSTTALPCLQLENSHHSELFKCWAWILNLLLPIMVLVSKGFVSWMMWCCSMPGDNFGCVCS